MDWGIPHKLCIGWGGVSLTPILVSPPNPETNTILFIPFILFLYHLIVFRFIISAWWRDLTIGNKNEIFVVLLIRLFGAFTLYHVWHFILFLMTLWNNWGYPMDFVLGVNDVCLFPDPPDESLFMGSGSGTG